MKVFVHLLIAVFFFIHVDKIRKSFKYSLTKWITNAYYVLIKLTLFKTTPPRRTKEKTLIFHYFIKSFFTCLQNILYG